MKMIERILYFIYEGLNSRSLPLVSMQAFPPVMIQPLLKRFIRLIWNSGKFQLASPYSLLTIILSITWKKFIKFMDKGCLASDFILMLIVSLFQLFWSLCQQLGIALRSYPLLTLNPLMKTFLQDLSNLVDWTLMNQRMPPGKDRE